jgi:hypothetical protein
MPLCIKDKTRSYKGNEPSPKGFGFCAHSESIGTIKNGLDGNLWIVVNTASKKKRWILYKSILTEDNIYYKIIKKKYMSYKSYYIHWNGEKRYLVYIKNKNIDIYDIPKNVKIDEISYKSNDTKWMYINLVKKIKAKKIFIGKSPLIKMTYNSGGHGKDFDGNTILLFVGNNNYIYIGNNIQYYKINDKIEKYYSFIGFNDIPYPMAIGKEYIYYFEYPIGYLPISEFPKLKNKKDLQSIFDKGYELSPYIIPFYKNKNGINMLQKKKLPKHKISLEEFKELKTKKLDEITLSKIKIIASMYNVTQLGTKKQIADRIENLKGIVFYKK